MAAVAADFSAPYNGPFYSETEWRQYSTGFFNHWGVIAGLGSELAVTADDTGMHVDVGIGIAHVAGATGEWGTSTELPIVAADSDPRIDMVVVRNRYSVASPAFVQGQMELDVVKGTPAVSPTRPTATTDSTMYEVPLAYVTVGASVSSIDAASVTDFRTFTTETSPSAKRERTATRSLADATDVPITMDTGAVWSAGCDVSGLNQIIVSTAGRYWVRGFIKFEANSTGYRHGWITKNTVQINDLVVTVPATASGDMSLPVGGAHVDCVAGDYFQVHARQTSGTSINALYVSLEVTYIGPSVNRQ